MKKKLLLFMSLLTTFYLFAGDDAFWNKQYGGNCEDEAFCIESTDDGEFILA